MPMAAATCHSGAACTNENEGTKNKPEVTVASSLTPLFNYSNLTSNDGMYEGGSDTSGSRMTTMEVLASSQLASSVVLVSNIVTVMGLPP